MELLIAVALVVAFDVAALIWGADTRPHSDAGQQRSI
jgi:hypothetical protein